MKKRILLTSIAIVAVAVGVVGMSAFEAHIINVTAEIENALFVPLEADGLDFGTVFPEEVLYQDVEIQLSSSFLGQDRLDDVEYMLRQKPKCGLPVPNTDPVEYSEFMQVTHEANGDFVCPGDSVMLPLLCPYLSKHELDAAGAPTGNGIDAFHGPLVGWTMDDTLATQLDGRLSIADQTTSALWNIDLHVPCFEGQCAQDYVIPVDYEADPNLEHELFGCDLWFEVTGFSLPPDIETTLTVIKVVENDVGGNAVAGDFTINVAGTNVSNPSFPGEENPGTTVTLDPGAFTVTEDPNSDYSTALTGDCDGVIAEGENLTCTVTNTYIEQTGTIEIIKIVENNGIGTLTADQFQMEIDGVDVPQNSPNVVPVGVRTIGEEAQPGYEMTFTGGDCDANGEIDVQDGQVYTCEVTNTFQVGTITVTKVVVTDDGGIRTIADFNLFVGATGVDSGVANNFAPATYTISESGISGYLATFTGDCDNPGHQITIAAGEDKSCTITNNDIRPVVTLLKNVVDGSALPTDFFMRVDGGAAVPHGGSVQVLANTDHQISEDAFPGYTFTSITGTNCPTDLDQDFQLTPGESITCTLTNTFTPIP